MSERVLVAYATRYGSTGEVAEAVGARLRESGLEADVRTLKEARPDDGYNAVVFGAPFYLGSLLKEGREWLERERTALAQRPLALFALGPISADEDPSEARQQLDKTLAGLEWMQPVAAEMFVGRFDPTRLRLADKLLTKLPASPLHALPARDDRDWGAIAAWADGLAALLRALPVAAA